MNIKNYILFTTIFLFLIEGGVSTCYATGAYTWSTTSSGDERCALAGGTCNDAYNLSGTSIDCSMVTSAPIGSPYGTPTGGSADCTITSGVGTTWNVTSSTGNVECAGLGRTCTDAYSNGVEIGCDGCPSIPVGSPVGTPNPEGTTLCGATLPTECQPTGSIGTKSYLWNNTDSTGLAYIWASVPSYGGVWNSASIGSRTVNINYNIGVTTLAGAIVADGSTVTAGTQLRLSFVPHSYSDISWNAGYGQWVANAAATGDAAIVVQCTSPYIVSSSGGNDSYASLLVAPPTKTMTIPAGMSSCTGLTCNATYGYSETCTINSTSTFSFNFAATFGKYYYKQNYLIGSPYGSPSSCDTNTNNVPLALSNGSSYNLTVPNIKISYTIYVGSNGVCGLNTNNTTGYTYANTATTYLGGTTLNSYYCSSGTASAMPAFPAAGNSASWTCNCTGTGCTTQNCTATKSAAVNGTCGLNTNNTTGYTYANTATTYLGGTTLNSYYCSSGTASAMPAFPAAGNSASWTCNCTGTGCTTQNCTATKSAAVNGTCGLNTNNTTGYTYANTATTYLGGTTLNSYYCSSGTASAMPAFPAAGNSASWTCNCTGTGCTTQNCTATKSAAVNGTCGLNTNNTTGYTYANTATTYLGGTTLNSYYCSSGTASAMPAFPAAGNSASWTCNCTGTGCTTQNCTATRALNGACGTAAGAYAY